jgi:hypothetical protein
MLFSPGGLPVVKVAVAGWCHDDVMARLGCDDAANVALQASRRARTHTVEHTQAYTHGIKIHIKNGGIA